MKCILCDFPETDVDATSDASIQTIYCRRCGRYQIDITVQDLLKRFIITGQMHMLISVSRHRTEADQHPILINENLLREEVFQENIASQVPKSIDERLVAILQYMVKLSNYPGTEINIEPGLWYPIGYCKNETEFDYYLDHLSSLDLIKHQFHKIDGTSLAKITVKGWEYIHKLSQVNPESSQAFVAMWFDKFVEEAFTEGIGPLEKDMGFTMLRIDMKQFNGKICDRIIAEIRRSRFLIADVTGQRPGVYFEAGYAMGLGLPVIWTCKDDDKDNIHFDTRQYNHILWQNPQDLHDQLKDRILATIGN